MDSVQDLTSQLLQVSNRLQGVALHRQRYGSSLAAWTRRAAAPDEATTGLESSPAAITQQPPVSDAHTASPSTASTGATSTSDGEAEAAPPPLEAAPAPAAAAAATAGQLPAVAAGGGTPRPRLYLTDEEERWVAGVVEAASRAVQWATDSELVFARSRTRGGSSSGGGSSSEGGGGCGGSSSEGGARGGGSSSSGSGGSGARMAAAVQVLRRVRPLLLLVQGLSALVQEGDCAAARELLEQAVKLSPRLPGAWHCLGHCYWEGGDLMMALHCLQTALKYSDQQQTPCSRGIGASSSSGISTATGETTEGFPGPATSAIATGARSGGSVSAGDASSTMRGADSSSAGGGIGSSSRGGSEAGGAGASSGAGAPGVVFGAREALQALSMLVRQEGQGLDRSAALSQSLAHARAALEVDARDGYSWYVLALAQLSALFHGQQLGTPQVGGRGERGREVQRLMASFTQAERCGLTDLADLYYNRAAVHTLCQTFGAALQDYGRAQALDPSLPVASQVEALVLLLCQLSRLVSHKGGVKANQWTKITALLARDAVQADKLIACMHHERLEVCGLSRLRPGVNRGAALLCRPLVFMAPPLNASATLYLVCVDTCGECFVLALVRVSHDAFDMAASLTLVHPEVVQVEGTWKGQSYRFPLLRGDASHDNTVLVNGVPLQQAAEPAALQATVSAR